MRHDADNMHTLLPSQQKAWRKQVSARQTNWRSLEKLRLLLYALFWVIPRRLNFICRRFVTLCSIFIGG